MLLIVLTIRHAFNRRINLSAIALVFRNSRDSDDKLITRDYFPRRVKRPTQYVEP